LPTKLTADHTVAAVQLASFDPMAQCVIDSGRAVGADVMQTLDHVEKVGMQRQGSAEWGRATKEVAPLRKSLQKRFLQHGLAESATTMDIDELRVCQIWMFSLASRLQSCQHSARAFAHRAGVQDVTTPLLGYKEDRWDLDSVQWQTMERCIHEQAASAGVDADTEWRKGQ